MKFEEEISKRLNQLKKKKKNKLVNLSNLIRFAMSIRKLIITISSTLFYGLLLYTFYGYYPWSDFTPNFGIALSGASL